MTVKSILKQIGLQVIFIYFASNILSAQSPGGVSGASLWYKSNVGVTNSSGVSQWNDQSGNARDLAQATATARPVLNTATNLINFNPTITFDGVNDVLKTAPINKTDIISGSDPYAASTYIVYRAKNTSSVLYSHSNGSGGSWNIGANTGFNMISNRSCTLPATIVNEIRLQSLQGISNGATDSRINGTTNSTTWTNTVNTSVNASDPFWLGAQGTSGFGNTEIAEFISFPNNSNSSNERQKVESYLGLKYGITLPFNYLASDATVYWDATANSIYNKNIVGIGKDTTSGLDQKQSQSINSGFQIIVSAGSMTTTNAANSNIIASDKQFLTIGDNGSVGYESFTDTFGNANIFSKSAKVWFADNTGNYNQATSIYIPEQMYSAPG
ncbi:hypothetical protein [Flavobacterium branchiophilum]|uniref:DUF8202 domain-containing protein n=1 Tax=Flavobacterium branchiophilum TaxID=55197 RepID=A0A2H3KFD8_9FLAO|nr:hypothetical protein [Flavobacterium branchiophilum]PDS21880.1 hypothetical protein B0A77_14840 [Flavobacterium branchiophilum]